MIEKVKINGRTGNNGIIWNSRKNLDNKKKKNKESMHSETLANINTFTKTNLFNYFSQHSKHY